MTGDGSRDDFAKRAHDIMNMHVLGKGIGLVALTEVKK